MQQQLETQNARVRSTGFAALLCVTIGVAISTLPHIVSWREIGEPVWIADHDELEVYLPLASRAFHNNPWRVTDVTKVDRDGSMYPWVQLAPGILVAKALGFGPLRISLIWRIWAGVTIALAWYALIYSHVRRPWVSAALAILLQTDGGLMTARLVVPQIVAFGRIVAGAPGQLFEIAPALHPEWRIVTPGLSLALMLLYLCLLGRARSHPTRPRLFAAGLAFAVLFGAYFYYWTAALGGLFLAGLLDRDKRAVYFKVGLLGCAGGFPWLVVQAVMNGGSLEWLHRSDKFVTIPRLSELLIPRFGILVALVTLPWVWSKRRELIYLWATGVAGLLLLNHQLITGLQIENFHWAFVWGPVFSLLLLLLMFDLVDKRSRVIAPLLLAVLACHVAIAGVLRGWEAVRTAEPAAILRLYERYREERAEYAFVPDSVVAGDRYFVDFAVILENQRPLMSNAVTFSASVDNDEFDERLALQGHLAGLDRIEFEAAQAAALGPGVWGPEGRSSTLRARRMAARMQAFDRVHSRSAEALNRFGVRYVALPTAQTPPDYLDSQWSCLARGATWQVWERKSG